MNTAKEHKAMAHGTWSIEDLLQQLGNGAFVEDVHDELRTTIEGLLERAQIDTDKHEASGTLTIALNVTVGADSQVVVTSDVKSKLPRKMRVPLVMRIEDGGLLAAQEVLPLRAAK